MRRVQESVLDVDGLTREKQDKRCSYLAKTGLKDLIRLASLSNM